LFPTASVAELHEIKWKKVEGRPGIFNAGIEWGSESGPTTIMPDPASILADLSQLFDEKKGMHQDDAHPDA
jgi:hypothetical protein